MEETEGTARTEEYQFKDQEGTNVVLSHIDSLLEYINSDEYGTVPIYLNSSYRERYQNPSEIVGETCRSYQDTYRSHTSSEEDRVFCHPSNSDFSKTEDIRDLTTPAKDEDKFEYLSQAIQTTFDSIRDCSVSTQGGRHQFKQKLDHLKAEFNNFYPVEMSLQKNDAMIVIEDTCQSANNDVHSLKMSAAKSISNLREHSRASCNVEQLNNQISTFAAIGKQAHSSMISTKDAVSPSFDIAECISIFMDTLNGILSRLPLYERQGTLESLKKNTSLKKLLQSPQSSEVKRKDNEYFTFNDLELRKSTEIDVMPLKEIMLHSVEQRPEVEVNRIHHESVKSELKRDSIASTARPGKTRVTVESIYHTGQSCDLFTTGTLKSSGLTQNSVVENTKGISFKKGPKALADHSSNKENRKISPNRYSLSGFSLQEPMMKSSKGYLKGARNN